MTDDATARPGFVSLYSGAGGLDLGFMAAGFVPLFANDINPRAMDTHHKVTGMLGYDPVEVTGDLTRHLRDLPDPGRAVIVIGGPPCQGFSVAGRMDPSDPRSKCVHDFLDVVDRLRPRAFVMENVKALAVNARWKGVRGAILGRARGMGYTVRMSLLDSSRFGVPQVRERMILIGTMDGTGFTPPSGSVARAATVGETMRSLPPLGEPGNDRPCRARIIPAKHPVLRRSPWAGMLFNGQGRPMDPDSPAPTLPASMGGNRTPIIDRVSMEDGSEPWTVSYHRSLMEGGPVADSVPDRLRRISVHEAAALQSFPGDMPWVGSDSAAYRQIGNAVPPRMAFHIASSLAMHMGLDARPVPSILDHVSGGIPR